MKSNMFRMTLITSTCLAVLSACGGGDDNVTPYDREPVVTVIPEPEPAATFPAQEAFPIATVVNDNGSLILAESGLSLYTFDDDTDGVSTCLGTAGDTTSCAGNWPPLLLSGAVAASDGFSFITRDDGEFQWAYNNQALYTYVQDSAQGDISGDGVNDVWHLARPMPIKTAMINDLESYVANQTILSATQSSEVLTPERANKEGFTLYTFDMDVTNSSACVGACIDFWPPLLADEGAQAKAPLSIIDLGEGLSQWAYKGKPLYFFANDAAAGDNNGDEVNDIWHTATSEPAIQRTTDNGRFLTATGMVDVLLPNDGSVTEFSVMNKNMDGFALYTFDFDSKNTSACSDSCKVAWPAFIPSEGDMPIGDFTIIDREDGNKQWAYKEMPVYFYAGDTAKSEINGDNLFDVWHIIKPEAAIIETMLVEEVNGLGATITTTGMVHVMLRDEDTMEFVDETRDQSGFALYTFDSDTAGVSNCSNSCLDFWPPLLADKSDVASAPYSIITRDNGMMQWAINDMPLYFFAGDISAESTLGDRANELWRIARPAPVKVDNHASKGDLLTAHGDVLASQGKTAAQLMGLTLYTFDDDTKDSGASTCFGGCAVTWPPLYATNPEQAFGEYTIISREEDNTTTYQWAYKGLPLYFFTGDSQVGDTNGDYPAWPIARP